MDDTFLRRPYLIDLEHVGSANCKTNVQAVVDVMHRVLGTDLDYD